MNSAMNSGYRTGFVSLSTLVRISGDGVEWGLYSANLYLKESRNMLAVGARTGIHAAGSG